MHLRQLVATCMFSNVLHSVVIQRCKWLVVLSFVFCLRVFAQFQAGLDFNHPFIILLNTDSAYYQTQSKGWFKFNTNGFNNISGNAVTLKAALIPTNTRIIAYDTVYLQRITIYDSLQNIVFSDTIHHYWDTLKIQVSLNKNQNYWLQAYANYPCGSCEYPDQPVTYQLKLIGNEEVLCAPYCTGSPTVCTLFLFAYNPKLGYAENCAYTNTAVTGAPDNCDPSCFISPFPGCALAMGQLIDFFLNGTNYPCQQVASGYFQISLNPSVTPVPYTIASPLCNIPNPTFTLCSNIDTLFFSEDGCPPEGGAACFPTIQCGNFNLPQYELQIINNNNIISSYTYTQYPVPIVTATLFPLLAPGTNSFCIQRKKVFFPQCPQTGGDCISQFCVKIETLTASPIFPPTVCVVPGQINNWCFSYNNPSSIFTYSTQIIGPNGYTFNSSNINFCLNNLTTPGVYTINSNVAFNYSLATSPTTGFIHNMFCNDTLIIVNTFTVIDCCINSKTDNITISSATLVPYGTPGSINFTSLTPNNVYSGLIAIPPSGNISNAVLTIQQSLKIQTNVGLFKCNILFSDGADLVIQNKSVVTFDRCYLHSCGIWRGITADNDGLLTVKHSVIEDAFNAINALNLNNFPLRVENSLFNKNWISINITNSKVSSFIIKNSIFTSRDLNPLLYNTVLSSSSPNSPNFNNIFSPTFLNSKPAGVLNSSLIFSALSGRRGETGIAVSGINSRSNVSYQYNNALFNPIVIGVDRNIANPVFENSTTNLFDFLSQGVVSSFDAQVQVINCQFQNINNYVPSVSQGAIMNLFNGTAFIGFIPSSSSSNSIRQANLFRNCKFGVHSFAGWNSGFTSVFGNYFTSCFNGIFIDTWNAVTTSNRVIQITQNTATNNTYFVNVFDSQQLSLIVASNTVTGGNYGVFINDVSNVANVNYSIQDNSFRNVWHGVSAQNTRNLLISKNSFTIQMAPFNITPPVPYQAGIELTQTINSNINNNRIIAFPPAASTYTKIMGIRMENASQNRIYCNNIQQTGVCIGVKDNCPSEIYDNQLGNQTLPQSRYGILGISNFDFIGDIQQPGSTTTIHYANNNVWGWLMVPNIQYANAAIWGLIPFSTIVYYLQNTSSPDYPVNVQTGVGRIATNVVNPEQCAPPPNIQVPGGLTPNALKLLMNVPNIPQRFGLITSRQTYRTIRDLNLQNTFSVQPVIQFETQFNTAKFYTADSLANQFAIQKHPSLISQAELLNNSIVPKDTIELIQQQFNQIYYKYLKNDSLMTTSDIAQLQNIATLCPMQVGLSVYQARALLKKYDSTEYISSCEGAVMNHQRLAKADDDIELPENVKIKVYPNPLKEDVLTIESDVEGEWILYDIAGKEVTLTHLKKGKSFVNLKVSKGIYFYKVLRGEKILRVDKLIIE